MVRSCVFGGLFAGVVLLAFGASASALSLEELETVVKQLGRQVMLQQLAAEERVRSDGDSGIKAVRLQTVGDRPYDADTHTSKHRWAAIHNHANNIRVLGMGEAVFVLNGVEFRTRHNDFPLFMPSNDSTQYHAKQEVPFPDVPPEVLAFTDVQDQVAEMREWFLAFATQNETHRYYPDYFKAVMCYLEGAWTSSVDALDEPFESDRHFVDAVSWFDLHEKIRLTSYNGGKSLLENYAFLPTTIMEMVNETTPRLAQWNYRIMCHPLKNNLPLNRFRLVDDPVSRMRDGMDWYQYLQSRAARFQLNPEDKDDWSHKQPHHQFLDSLMEEIPGKDNYPADIIDSADGQTAYPAEGDMSKPLNVGYYHRAYKINRKDAMGKASRRRGFQDGNLFAAATTNPQVSPMKVKTCDGDDCTDHEVRWSYAIPLEIVYLTPLSTWNPYNLVYKGKAGTPLADTVTDGRTGSTNSTTDAFNGTNSKVYYMTPYEFYLNDEQFSEDTDPADTTTGGEWVLDPNDVPRYVVESGVNIHFMNIPGVGRLRQRYPIAPVHGEGNTIAKGLAAIEDIVMEPDTYRHMRRQTDARNPGEGMTLKLTASSPATGAHEHFIDLTGEEVDRLYDKDSITVTTSAAGPEAHEHELVIKQTNDWIDGKKGAIYYKHIQCDGLSACEDKHPRRMVIMP